MIVVTSKFRLGKKQQQQQQHHPMMLGREGS
jgi:hypothetical protein